MWPQRYPLPFAQQTCLHLFTLQLTIQTKVWHVPWHSRETRRIWTLAECVVAEHFSKMLSTKMVLICGIFVLPRVFLFPCVAAFFLHCRKNNSHNGLRHFFVLQVDLGTFNDSKSHTAAHWHLEFHPTGWDTHDSPNAWICWRCSFSAWYSWDIIYCNWDIWPRNNL